MSVQRDTQGRLCVEDCLESFLVCVFIQVAVLDANSSNCNYPTLQKLKTDCQRRSRDPAGKK